VSPPFARPPSPPGHRKPAAKGAGSRRGFGATWWGGAWVDALQGRARLDPNRLPRGRSYARSGAVGELAVAPGEVTALVQGSRARPYKVSVRVREFDAREWNRLLDIVAGQVGHTAALLDGELPPEILDDATAAKVELLPGPGDLQPRCSCPDWADPCKHAAAVCFLVADVLDADPFALLLLRGREREAVLSALRTRRGGRSAPVEAEHERDSGVPARLAFARADRPQLPGLPLPSAAAGRPAMLAADPPASSGINAASLSALAADAAARAHALLLGEGDGGLGLDRDSDLARRASELIGSTGFPDLARRAGVPGRVLFRRALAWRYGGPDGLAVLSDSWKPDGDDLADGRRALGDGARAKDNRLTLGNRQLRLAADGRWFPFVRRSGNWDPAGPASFDPAEAVDAFDAD
jgi:uncharacterized Zn finger protein